MRSLSKRIRKCCFLAPIFLFSFGFAQGQSESDQNSGGINQDGYILLKTRCYACHNPAVSTHETMLAPPLAGIKMHYKSKYPSREAFISAVTSFVGQPSEENALMRGPLRRFGLMPNPNLEAADIKLIAAYLYDNEVEAPAWFEEHRKERMGETR